MTIHKQGHPANSTIDHTVGTTPAAGQVNVIGTSSAPAIVETTVEAPADVPASSTIVKRQTNGQIKLPTSGHSTDEAVNLATIQDMIDSGIARESVHSVVADHTAATVGDTTPIAPQTTDPALAVGDLCINTADDKIYEVTSIAGGTTGDLVVWDAGLLETVHHKRIDKSTDDNWNFNPDGSVGTKWINNGATDHTRLHAMTDALDHSTGAWKLHYSNATAMQELALAALNSPLLGGGVSAAPAFGTLLFAPAPITCAGVDPVDTDVSAWGNNTIGICVGTGGLIFVAYKNATDVYYAQLTAI